MKKYTKIITVIFAVLLLFSLSAVLTACGNDAPAAVYISVDGDIQGGFSKIDLGRINQSNFSFTEKNSDKTVNATGWEIGAILDKITPLYDGNKLMITAKDGVSAVIDMPLTAEAYIVKSGNSFDVKAPDYPAVVGIKGISEITVIADENPTLGLKSPPGENIVVTEPITDSDDNFRTVLSRGNAKLLLFENIITTRKKDNEATKYIKYQNFTVSDFTTAALDKEIKTEKNIAYFRDFDIASNVSGSAVGWSGGRITCNTSDGKAKNVTGFVTGTDKLNYQVYSDMVEEIDNDKRVMFVLLDGFSYQQAIRYSDVLTSLKPENGTYGGRTRTFSLAASTNPAKSEVALASFLTGKSPFVTTVTSKANRNLAVPDIFKYASDKGKSALYVEGDTAMITNTSLRAILNAGGDGKIKKCALDNMQGKDAAVVHFHEIDDQNHNTGAMSAAAKTKISEVEGYLNELLVAFDGTVIAVADHGHNTLRYGEGGVEGGHAMFNNYDMYVPYYVFR